MHLLCAPGLQALHVLLGERLRMLRRLWVGRDALGNLAAQRLRLDANGMRAPPGHAVRVCLEALHSPANILLPTPMGIDRFSTWKPINKSPRMHSSNQSSISHLVAMIQRNMLEILRFAV